MSLEKVDLLSVLRKAKSNSVLRGSGEPVAPPAATPADRTAAGAVEPEPGSSVIPTRQEMEELADLKAELFNDEMLMQRILGLLYRRKKSNPNGGFISILEMERILNVEREGAAFIMSYMKTQKVMEMDDKSRLAITVPGINYLRSVLGLHGGPSDVAPLDSLTDERA